MGKFAVSTCFGNEMDREGIVKSNNIYITIIDTETGDIYKKIRQKVGSNINPTYKYAHLPSNSSW